MVSPSERPTRFTSFSIASRIFMRLVLSTIDWW
jgi:hypothetical protein